MEERFKELENDKSRLNQDRSIVEKQLKETEGVRRNLFEKNRVKILLINSKMKFSFFLQEHQEDLLDLIHEKELLEEKVLQHEQTIREWAQKFIEATDKQKLIQINYENLLQQQYKCLKKNFFTQLST